MYEQVSSDVRCRADRECCRRRALTAQDRVDLAMVARIRAEATERSKVLETFNYITNVTGARPTGSRAHKQAADYVRAKLDEWGLTNAHLEPFQFGRGWELQKFTLELTAPRYFPMYGYPLAWTPSTKGVLTGTPIYLADKTAAEIEALGEKLRGAIVLASPPQTVFQLPIACSPPTPISWCASAARSRRPSGRRSRSCRPTRWPRCSRGSAPARCCVPATSCTARSPSAAVRKRQTMRCRR